MPSYKIIKMCHLSPIHIGNGRESYDSSGVELQSDTLSAALAAIGITTGLISDPYKFLSSFKVSSAFPFYLDLFFLPKPQGRLNVRIKGHEEHEYRKNLKKVKYIESSLWTDITTGQLFDIEESQIKGDFLMRKDKVIPDKIRESVVSERVCVSRTGEEDAMPFDFEWQFYDRNAGLYCLVESDEETFKTIDSLFRLLGETGIGTDKSIGGGKFEVETSSMEIGEAQNPDSSMLLSLYIPTVEEFGGLLDGCPKYSLVQRGGYMAGSNNEEFRHLHKKSIYMFGVGSVFSTTKMLDGRIVNLQPEWNATDMHPVYRSGRTIILRIKSNEQ